MIGNGIFFFVSGYTLYFSLQRIQLKWNEIVLWFAKRLLRIYPAYWVYIIVCQAFDVRMGGGVRFVDLFVTNYWFLNSIIVCYAIYFVIVKFLFRYWPVCFCISGLMFAILLALYADSGDALIIEGQLKCFRWFYLFQIMLLGGYAASDEIKTRPKQDLALAMLFLVLYYAYKAVCIRLNIYYLQLLLPILLIVLIYYTYSTVCRYAQRFDFSAAKWKPVYAISKLTLEIYIVQFAVIRFFTAYHFPIGLLCAIVSILLTAGVLHYVTQWIQRPILSFLQKYLLLNYE